jgi:sugar/nucleoside kinase (ribokinase family)
VPNIHANLTSLTGKARRSGCLTVVGTVYDFINQKNHPERPWPLGEGEETYTHLDLLITDKEEALRLSGKDSLEAAQATLIAKGVGALVTTNGAEDVFCYSDGRRLRKINAHMPVSTFIEEAKNRGPVKGDTTGAGDNFAGGIIASLMMQMASGGELDLEEACAWGIVSGDFACFYVGGTYLEKKPGEKAGLIHGMVEAYAKDRGNILRG